MKVIEIESEHRRKHFEFFRQMNHPHFNICAPVDVTEWVTETKTRGLKLNLSLVYLLVRALNMVPQFRWRLRGEQIVEHAVVHPSMTVRTDETDVFSFCEVKFDLDMASFLKNGDQQVELMRSAPSIADEPGRDDYLFMSALPWMAFTSVAHAMSYHPHDSVPRITWGKFTPSDGRLMMPLAIQAHHALVDGIHMGSAFQTIEEMAKTPRTFMDG